MGLYAQGLGYSTLNTASSALSSILCISDCQHFGQRGQSIHLMALSAMKLTESECQFRILNHTKTSITISEFEQDPRICPLMALKEYLDRTQGLQNGEQCLFISYVKPHGAISRDTISRWMKSVLESSGIDSHKFSTHSTRAAAASRAKQKDVPLDVILAHVGWHSAETFRKFYDKPVIPSKQYHGICHFVIVINSLP